MEIINVTPHSISLANEAGEIVATFSPSGEKVRVATHQEVVGTLFGAEVRQTVYGDLTGLPQPREGVVYLASSLVAQQAAREGRTDVVAPDTGATAIRENGQVVAVRGFQSF